MKLSEFNNFVRLEEESHRYFRNSDNQELQSVSKILKLIEEPFDAKRVSRNMTESEDEAIALQKEWLDIAKTSTDWGTLCHKQCENFFKLGRVDNKSFEKLNDQLLKISKRYKKNLSEYILHDDVRLVAGTSDHIGLRNTVGKFIVVDINDFKTNIRKGIMNFSGKNDENGEFLKYYNKFLLHPLEYLQDCNYIKYCLQLSIYAFLLETFYDNVKIGALNIFFINDKLEIKPIPAPYMRHEAFVLLEHYTKIKDINSNELITGKLKKNDNFAMVDEIIDTSCDYSNGNDPDDDGEWV